MSVKVWSYIKKLANGNNELNCQNIVKSFLKFSEGDSSITKYVFQKKVKFKPDQ